MFEANLQQPVFVRDHLDLHEQMLSTTKQSLEKTKKRLHDAELTLNLTPNEKDVTEQTVWNDKIKKLIDARDNLPFPSLYNVRKQAEVKEMRDLETALANRKKPRKVFKVEKEKYARSSHAKDLPKTATLGGSSIPGEVIGKIDNYAGLNSFHTGSRVLIRRSSANVIGDNTSLPPWFGLNQYENSDPSVLSPVRDDRYRVAFRATTRAEVQKESQQVAKNWRRQNEVRKMSKSLLSLSAHKHNDSDTASAPTTLMSSSLSKSSRALDPHDQFTSSGHRSTHNGSATLSQRQGHAPKSSRIQVPNSTLGAYPTYTQLLPTSYGDHNGLISHLLVNVPEALNSGLGRRKKPRDYTLQALARQVHVPRMDDESLYSKQISDASHDKEEDRDNGVAAVVVADVHNDVVPNAIVDGDNHAQAPRNESAAPIPFEVETMIPLETVPINQHTMQGLDDHKPTKSVKKRKPGKRTTDPQSISEAHLETSECLHAPNYYTKFLLPKRTMLSKSEGKLLHGNTVHAPAPRTRQSALEGMDGMDQSMRPLKKEPVSLDVDVLAPDADITKSLRHWYLKHTIHPKNHRFNEINEKTKSDILEMHGEEVLNDLLLSHDSMDSHDTADNHRAADHSAFNREFVISRHQKQRAYMDSGGIERNGQWDGLLLESNPYTPNDEYVRSVAEELEKFLERQDFLGFHRNNKHFKRPKQRQERENKFDKK